MKSSVVKLAMAALALCAVVISCGKNPEQTKTPELTLGAVTELSFEAAGNQATFTFTSNQDWEVSSGASWVKADPTSGKASEQAVTVTVTCVPNNEYEARSTTILVKAGELSREIPVTQAAAEKPVNNVPEGAIDLGLSVYWGTCNLGASKPEETGKFFAWGDTSPKEWYDWQHYQWYDDGNNIIKYNTLAKWGQVDNLTALTTGPDGDDAVSATVGGKWRMPTDDELYEIAAYSTSTDIQWTWTEDYNGTKVNGFIVSSGKEEYAGNSIFLPVAGRYEGNQYLEKGTSAGYWSSSLNTDSPRSAWAIFLLSYEDLNGLGKTNTFARQPLNRVDGYCIRPVCEK